MGRHITSCREGSGLGGVVASPGSARAELLRGLRDRSGCDTAAYIGYASRPGGTRRCAVTAVGSATDDFRVLEGQPAVDGEVAWGGGAGRRAQPWSASRPPAILRDTLVSDRRARRALGAQRNHAFGTWLARGGRSYLRGLFYDVDQLVGQVVLVFDRAGAASRIPALQRTSMARRARPRIVAAAHDEDERWAVASEVMVTIVDAAGQPVMVSDAAAAWFDGARQAALAAELERCQDTTVIVRDGAVIGITRLSSATGGGPYFNVTFAAVERPRLCPLSDLTPRQREVCEFAAHGATIREIAVTTSLADNTVKHHLRNAYDRLGVSSRIELAEALSG